MAAGLSDHIWTLEELIGRLEEAEAMPIKRGQLPQTADFKLTHHRQVLLTKQLQLSQFPFKGRG
jgi:hypothetical protein